MTKKKSVVSMFNNFMARPAPQMARAKGGANPLQSLAQGRVAGGLAGRVAPRAQDARGVLVNRAAAARRQGGTLSGSIGLKDGARPPLQSRQAPRAAEARAQIAGRAAAARAQNQGRVAGAMRKAAQRGRGR